MTIGALCVVTEDASRGDACFTRGDVSSDLRPALSTLQDATRRKRDHTRSMKLWSCDQRPRALSRARRPNHVNDWEGIVYSRYNPLVNPLPKVGRPGASNLSDLNTRCQHGFKSAYRVLRPLVSRPLKLPVLGIDPTPRSIIQQQASCQNPATAVKLKFAARETRHLSGTYVESEAKHEVTSLETISASVTASGH